VVYTEFKETRIYTEIVPTGLPLKGTLSRGYPKPTLAKRQISKQIKEDEINMRNATMLWYGINKLPTTNKPWLPPFSQ
jgi:hypothetical protein